MPEPLADQGNRTQAEQALDCSLAIEAAAGTGKTTLLVRRLLNLLAFADVDDPPRAVRIDEVVAVTFTEKAAGELKSRLRDRLEQAVREGRIGTQTLTAAQVGRLRRALYELDGAPIGTIHSFCASLIHERPVEAGVDPERRVADPLTQTLLLDEAWESWCDVVLDGDDAGLAGALAAGLPVESLGGSETPSLRELAFQLVGPRDLLAWLPRPIPARELIGRLRGKLHEELPNIERLERHCLQHDQPNPRDAALKSLRRLQSLQEQLANSEAEEAMGELKQFGAFSPGCGSTQWDPKESLDEANALIKRWWKDIQATVTHEATANLAASLRQFVSHYEKLKSDRGVFDFQDLLIIAQRLLASSSEVRRYFRRRYRYLLIDEFQDTDPLQVEVARLLTEREQEGGGQRAESRGPEEGNPKQSIYRSRRDFPSGPPSSALCPPLPSGPSPSALRPPPLERGRLFVVGDPKQSIYRFRRADIETYERTIRSLESREDPASRSNPIQSQHDFAPGASTSALCSPPFMRPVPTPRLTIQCNFRSGRGIIDMVNRVFGGLIQPSVDGYYQPDYVPLEPGPNCDKSPGGQVLLVYPPDWGATKEEKTDRTRFLEGCAIARLVQQAVRDKWPTSLGRPIDYGDVAILFERMTGLEHYEEAFQACELPYQIIGGRHYYRRLEVQSLQAVLEAIDDPENGVALVAALRSPFFGISDEMLYAHVAAGLRLHYLNSPPAPAGSSQTALGPLHEPFLLLRQLHDGRNDQSVERTVRQLFDETKVLEMFLLLPQGEQRAANLLKVLETAGGLERTGLLTFRRFVRWLRDRAVAEEEEGESLTAEPGDPVVRVMTIHKAKGLEFGMTVLAGFSSGRDRSPDGLVISRAEKRIELCCGELRTLGWPQAKEWEKSRREAERRRLFYVAATRARDYLVLPVFWHRQVGGFQCYLANDLPKPPEIPWGERLLGGPLQGAVVVDTPEYGKPPAVPHKPAVDIRQPPTPAEADTMETFLGRRADFCRDLELAITEAAQGRPVLHPSSLNQNEQTNEPGDDLSATTGVQPFHPSTLGQNSPDYAASALGSLVHRLLALCFSRAVPAEDLQAVAAGLASEFQLDHTGAADAAGYVRRTVDSPFGKRLQRVARCWAEVPFCHTCDGAIVEGSIDLLVEEEGRLLLVDFKTDRVEPGHESTQAEQYAPQLQAYAAAVAAATGQTVGEAIVFFVRTLRAVPLPISAANSETPPPIPQTSSQSNRAGRR